LNATAANLNNFNITAGAGIGTLNAKNITGASSITALLVGAINVKGDLGSDTSDVHITLTNTTAKVGTAPPKDALGNLTVGGWVKSTAIRSAGNIGTVKVGAMDSVTLFAGVADAVDDGDLPQNLSHFVGNPEHAKIKSLTVTGISGVTKGSVGGAADWMADFQIAAYEVTTSNVGYFKSDNGGQPFGFALHTYGTITYKGDQGTTHPTFGAGVSSLQGDGVLIMV
jgi:hypothetical protein